MKTPSLAMGKAKLSQFDFNKIVDDFRHLNPNDVGSWALAPRIAALALIFIAILTAGWWFIWNDQLTSLDTKKQDEDKLKQEFLDKKKQAINLDLYKQQLNEIDQTFGALLKQLPNKSEMEALLTEINQAGMGRGLQFELFKPGTEQLKDFYAELPVTIRVSGSFNDLGAFAADIAKLPRIVTLNNIAITSAPGSRLAMDATAKTFRYLDEEEIAKTKQAAKKQGGKK